MGKKHYSGKELIYRRKMEISMLLINPGYSPSYICRYAPLTLIYNPCSKHPPGAMTAIYFPAGPPGYAPEGKGGERQCYF